LIAAPTPAGLLATKLLILGKYLVLLVFPHPLVYDYSYNQIPFTTFSDPTVWITLAVYLAAAGYLVRVLYRRISGQKTASGETLAAFSVAWFFMGFAASSNLFMLIGSTMGERFMYAPSLGFILTVVWLGYRLALLTGKERRFRGHPSLMLYLFCGLLFSAFLLKTIARNRAWKDDFTLYSTDIVHLQNNVKANDFLANAYRERGDKADETGVKQEYYRQAIALKGRAEAIYPKVPEIQRQLGELYGNTGQFGKAIGAYGEAVALNPSDAVSHLQIGKAYGMMKQPAEGLTWMEKAEQLDPSNPDVLVALGVTHAQLGHLDRAIGYFERTLARDPSNPVAAKYLDMAKKQSVKL